MRKEILIEKTFSSSGNDDDGALTFDTKLRGFTDYFGRQMVYHR